MSIDLIPGIKISSSGLDAERARMEITANNLANVHSTAGPNGEVYRKKIPVFKSVMNDAMNSTPGSQLGGVKIEEIVSDNRAPLEIYAPYHPSANKDGMVAMPNISPIEEMVDMITATRAYEANLSVMKQSRTMADKTITLGKG
jgi:flagellar basal-body rod protein FlgC